MIDSGSDYTVVQPEVLLPHLHAAGLELRNDDARNQIVLQGIGPTPLTCLVQPAGLRFVDEQGRELVFANPILVPRPTQKSDARAGTSRVPSLLGRDVIQRFEFNLSYDPPSVALALND